MENFSRRLLAALICGAAGPAAAVLTALATGVFVLSRTIADPTSLGDMIVGVLVGAMIVCVLAAAAGAVATLVVLRATHCPWSTLAWLATMLLMPVWASVVDQWGGGALDWPAYVATMGVVPMVVRLAFDCLPVPTVPASD